MCGIAGIVVTGNAPSPHPGELARMIGALQHRGPDGFGQFCNGPVGLAHARLSIIDLAGGDQPIHNEDGDIQVVFNGEIFNYIELRATLQAAGHRFYTQSDTEVIVHAYEEHGLDFVQHLNGQFAIALWDGRSRTLVLARDRTGIRPLFYVVESGRLHFASEIKSLFALPGLTRRFDAAGLADVFTTWAPLPGRTVFEGVHALPPGHLMTVRSGQMQVTSYWDWNFDEAGEAAGGLERNAADLRQLLIDAVRLQLRADVPVGAYLSGGLDSAVITALVRHYTDSPVRTFSVTFDDSEFDESAWQDELVRHLGTQHTALRIRAGDVATAFARVVWHAEVPLPRTAPAPLMLLAQRVRAEGYKVVLTGEGADEVFGGYDVFKEARVRRFMAAQPKSRWRGRVLERLYPYLRHSPVAGVAMAQAFFGRDVTPENAPIFGHVPRWNAAERLFRYFTPDMRGKLGQHDPQRELIAALPVRFMDWAPLARDQYIEQRTLLAGYLLSSQGDRMAMAHSIEARFPFLDHRVVEFAARLPASQKLRGLREKRILKHAVADLLPPSVLSRPKQPYRAPDSASFFSNGRLVDYAAALLSESVIRDAGLFEPRAVSLLVEKCRQGRAIGFGDNIAFVAILSTMLLHRMMVRAGQPSADLGLATPQAVAA